MEIRVMKEQDISQIVGLEQRCFHMPWTKKMLEKELENPVTYYVVIEKSKQIIAYAGIWLVAGEAELMHIAVDPDFRGKGFSKLLLQELITYVKQNHGYKIFLEVRKGNEIARNLYSSYCFNPIAVRKNYYQKPQEDGIVMELSINV